MKKSTDIILRIIFIVAIFGAIGNYYYNRFRKPVAPVLKSNLIKIEINNTQPTAIKQEADNKTQSIKKNITKNKPAIYTIKVIFKKGNEKNIKKQLLRISDKLQLSTKEIQKQVIFKRVLLGPYKKKTNLIKDSTKISNLKIDYLRLKIKGKYYLHIGSFSNPSKLNEFMDFLHKYNFNNIVFMEIKVPQKFIEMTINNIDNNSFSRIKNFLDKNHFTYKIVE